MMVRTLIATAVALAALAPSLAEAQAGAHAEPPRGETIAEAGYDRDPGPTADTRDREAWMDALIVQEMSAGSLDKRQGKAVLRELDHVFRFDAAYREPDGKLSPEQARDIHLRLDAVRATLLSIRKNRETTGPRA
jgi:hypothetical protein